MNQTAEFELHAPEAGARRKPQPRYPAYRNSGVGWLGEVPEHWDVRRWRYCCRITEGQVDPKDERYRETVLVAPNHVESGTGRLLLAQTADEQGAISGKYLVGNGDIIYSKIRPALNKACIAEGNWLCGADMYPVRVATTDLLSRYLLYFVLSGPFVRTMVDESMRVAMPKVNRDTLASCPVPLPPRAEQAGIVFFLDRETARIDALVERKLRLIELLREERAAIIARAVTRGLDPAAATRDSGDEYLGPVPAHWVPTPLMHLTQPGRPIMYGIVLPGPDAAGGVPIVKGGDVAPGRLQLDVLKRTSHEIEAGYARSRLRPGDIVYAIRGSIGMAELVPNELDGANITQDAARIAPVPGVDRRWLLYAVRSGPVFAQLDARATGATIRGINIRDLKRALIPLPPPAEQSAIAEHLDHEVSRIDALIAKVEEHQALFAEHRRALIAAAVTGQIDVRNEVPA